MPHFVSTEPVRISIEGSEEWIAIKPRLSIGEKNELYNAMISASPGDVASSIVERKADVDMNLRIGSYLTRLMEIAITDWYLLDDKGNPIPFNRNRIQSFDPDDPLIDKVLAEIATRNPFQAKTASGASS